MKTIRFIFAAVLVAAASACSADVTAPELAAPAAPSALESPPPPPDEDDPEPGTDRGSGLIGAIGG
jgi:hypothetical protein